MNKESYFTRIFPLWKSGTKASGFPVFWLIVTGYLEKHSKKSFTVAF
jgi:hypothetical protein